MRSQLAEAELPPVLRRVAVWMMALMAGSLASTVLMTRVLHMDHPWGVLWIWKGNQWCDFFYFQDRSQHFMTPTYWDDTWGYPITYPAPVAVVLGLFYKLRHPFQAYYSVIILGIVAWGAWLASGLISRGIRKDQAIGFALVMVTSTWPIAYLLDTANTEGITAILLAFGVLAVLKDRSWLGATLIAMAASLKLFPIILLALLLSKRRYKEFAFGCLLAPVLIVGSLAILGPSISVANAHIADGLDFLKTRYILSRGAMNFSFSHSLFNPVKFAVLRIDRQLVGSGATGSEQHEAAVAEAALRIYSIVVAVIGTALYFWRIRKLPMLNQLICLTVAALVLTPFSSDYTLIHTLVPFTLLCFCATEQWRKQGSAHGLNTCFACLCVILAWITFCTWGYVYNDFVRCLALLALMATAMRNPLPWAALEPTVSDRLASA